ncbi:CD109 antigen [Fundulus heteroclitus]|uniref:CD109 antigen n=1 Tax=Fundulus heteroclitus TaxID=8078 RepID=UPI00165B1D89|nr:CD109 antigen [Fundulus heteroclitus]
MSLFGSFGPGAALSGPGVLVGRQKVGSFHQNPKPRAGSFVSGSVSSLRPDAWTDTGPAPRPGSQPSYLLLAPAALRPGLPTSVSVSILSSSAFTVSAHIIHQGQTLSSSSTTVRGGTTGLLTLPAIHKARPGRPYILKVRGHGGVDQFFSNSTELLLHAGISTFIQTDRAAYLPGQVVKIRVVSVLADGKPCVGPAHILIRDPRGNRVRQWLDEAGVLGVVSAEFPLSGRPPLGRWSVTASVSELSRRQQNRAQSQTRSAHDVVGRGPGKEKMREGSLVLKQNPAAWQQLMSVSLQGVTSEKSFTVAHYVLPKFEVLIDAPAAVHQEDVLEGFVSAKYSYGEPVRGRMAVTVSHGSHGDVQTHSEEQEIDGSGKFSFVLSDFHHAWTRTTRYHERSDHLTIQVSVTEHLTGLTYNNSVNVTLAKKRFHIHFEDFPKVLRPSLSFSGRLKISRYNGEPLTAQDQTKTVKVSVLQQKQRLWDQMLEEEMLFSGNDSSMMDPDESSGNLEVPLPADGVVPLDIRVLNDTQHLTVEVSFEDCQKTLSLDMIYASPSHAYLQVQRPSRPAEVGSRLQLKIERNFAITDVHYLVKARGQLVSAGRSSGDLTLVPGASWAPLASIVVYCVRPDGEVVSDVIHLPMARFLQNKVSLRWSSDKVKPAEKVALQVSVAEPGSLVGILVVDKATRWAGSHNDISMETVLKEIMEPGASRGEAHRDQMTMGDAYSIFQMCDLAVMTDASLHKASPTWHDLSESGAEPSSPTVSQMIMLEAESWPMCGGHPGFDSMDLLSQPTAEVETAFPLQMDAEPFEKQPELHERQNFPETWVWMDIIMGPSASQEVPLTVPDSITTWTASAFVVSENLGLGITESAAELTVFQDFFLSLNLPAYIVRGEELVLEVVLFNYLQEDLEVTVIVADSSSFEFIFPDSEAVSMASVRHVYLEREGGATVLILIRTLVLGEIPISVKAVSSAASDYVRTAVLVKAEGLQQTFSSSLLLDLHEKKSSVSRDVKFSFPAGVVEGSQSVSVTAVGDLLGPSITGLDSLIQMPSGCGEQNMVHFAPNIYVLQYLRAKGPVDPVTQRATAYMMKGYEQELSYQRSDGSFSAFGEQDASGSTWLSAFVLRCFLQARPFISMDERVLGSVAAWLAGQQGGDGRMLEPGRVIHTELQGGLDGPVSLTSYVLMALLEDSHTRAQYATQVSAARSYLETRLDQGVSSNYSLSLLTYALALAGSPASQTAVNRLIGRADVRDGVPTWSSPDGGLSSSWQPRSADIEMAAYVLLSLHKLDRVAEGLGLLKWLSQQRNHLGGYGSTQDTVVALQALSRFTALGGAQRSDINIRVTRDSDTVASFHIDQDNELLLQTQQIDPEPELSLQVTAEGRGLALFQLNVFYNIRTEELRRRRDTDEQEAFYLYVHLVDHGLNDTYLYICNSLSWDLGLNETGMVLMEVGLLSGFALHPDLVKLDGAVKKVETQLGKVVLYLDSVSTQETCLYVPLLVEFKVGKVQEATVAVYDYYEPRRRTVRSYRSSWRGDASVCSFCGEDCSQCGTNDYSLNAAPRHGRCAPASGVLPALLLLFIICSN